MSSNAAGDVNNRDDSLRYVFDELESDAADHGYILSRLERLEGLMDAATRRGAVGMELTRIVHYIEGKQRKYLGELARLRVPED